MNQETQNQLSTIIDNKGIELTDAETIKQSYIPYFNQLAEIKEQTKKIDFANPTELDEKIAKELRLKVVKIRTGSEAIKNERKRIHSLKANIEQDAWNLIKSTCLLEEEQFVQIEKRREIAEKTRLEALKKERIEILTPFVEFISIEFIDISSMSEEDFQKQIANAKILQAASIEAKKKIEEERVAKLKAEEEERQRLKAENEKLKAENEAKQKAIIEAKQKEAEAAAKAKAESDKKLEEERKISEAKFKKEQEAKEKLQAELKAKADAEAKQKAEEEAKRKAVELAEKKAKSAPEKQKLIEYGKVIAAIILKEPELTSPEAKQILISANLLLQKVEKFIFEKAETL
jgi:colicin import membrane protein